MNDITVSKSNLPTNIDDLAKFALIGREKLVAVRAEIRAIEKVGLAQEVREQKLREAQDISEAVLDAEVRIGQLMAQVPTRPGARTDIEPHNTDDKRLKADVIREAGFTPMQVSRFQTLAANPEIVEQAKAEARENDDIVSRSMVLNKVKEKKEEAKRKEFEPPYPSFNPSEYGEASMPEGQKKALKRTIDAITASGRKAALFVCSHDVSDTTQDIDAAKAKVRWYYYDHRQIWEHKDRNVKEATDAYLAKMEELLCDAKRNKELSEGLSDPGADSTDTRM